MTAIERQSARGPAPPVLPPYSTDFDGRNLRRRRFWIYAGVVAFCVIYGFAFALFAPFLILFFAVPLVILALVAIWALPDRRTAPTRSLEALLFAFVVCLVVWPNYIALAPPGLPWITMVRLTGFPLAVALLICTSTSAAFRTQVGETLKAAPYTWKMLVAFVALQALSIGFSRDPPTSIDKFVVAQISWTAIFFTSVYVFSKPGRAERMVAVLWGMAIVVGLIAVAEFRAQHVLWAGHIPSFLQIDDPNVVRTLGGHDRFGKYRATSTFGTPLGLGEYMAMVTPIVLWVAMGSYSLKVRAFAGVSVVFFLVVAILSGARVGTIGCLLSILLSFAAWSIRKWRRDSTSLVGPALTLGFPIVAAGVAAAITFIGRLHHMFWGDGSEHFSNEARLDQVSLAIPKIISHPWGYGIGMGATALNYRPFGILSIDSYYLDILLEYGVLGFIVYYTMLIFTMIRGFESAEKANLFDREREVLLGLGISLMSFIIIKSSFSEQDNHPLVFMIMGMIVALVHRVALSRDAAAPLAAPDRTSAASRRGDRVRATATAVGGLRRPAPAPLRSRPPQPPRAK